MRSDKPKYIGEQGNDGIGGRVGQAKDFVVNTAGNAFADSKDQVKTAPTYFRISEEGLLTHCQLAALVWVVLACWVIIVGIVCLLLVVLVEVVVVVCELIAIVVVPLYLVAFVLDMIVLIIPLLWFIGVLLIFIVFFILYAIAFIIFVIYSARERIFRAYFQKVYFTEVSEEGALMYYIFSFLLVPLHAVGLALILSVVLAVPGYIFFFVVHLLWLICFGAGMYMTNIMRYRLIEAEGRRYSKAIKAANYGLPGVSLLVDFIVLLCSSCTGFWICCIGAPVVIVLLVVAPPIGIVALILLVICVCCSPVLALCCPCLTLIVGTLLSLAMCVITSGVVPAIVLTQKND